MKRVIRSLPPVVVSKARQAPLVQTQQWLLVHPLHRALMAAALKIYEQVVSLMGCELPV